MPEPLVWTLSLALAFLVGSVPFGVLIARARGVDIRAHGSGNVGATNVLRVLGLRAGLLCFALDVLKGALPVIVAGAWAGVLGERAIDPSRAWLWLAVTFAAPLGHMFSPWIGFRGGKGVATGFGALLGVFPFLTVPALLALLVFVLSAWRTRYVGVSSCLAAISVPLFVALGGALWGGEPASAGVRDAWPFLIATTMLAALVVWKHRSNIARTLRGTENKIGARRAGP